MEPEKIHILIVEDHPIVRRGLKDIITDEYPQAEFAEAGDSRAALEAYHRRKWAIILLDINIPGRDGLEVLEQIRCFDPAAKVLIVSAFPQEEFAIRAFRLGAAGYLHKNQAPEELIAALKSILAGQTYVTLSLAQTVIKALSAEKGSAPHEALSPRELQVFRLIAGGKSIKQIAEELALSEKTVGTYRARIAEKTGLSSNVELTRYAFQNGLTE
jgi:two-component system, NarL family, invasion response regulator UvrY